MTRNICVTAADGHTGFLIAELILKDKSFKSKVGSVSVLSLHPTSHRAKELSQLGACSTLSNAYSNTQPGAKVIHHKPGRERDMVKTLKEIGADTVCLIPPAHKEKYDVTMELINATKKANVPNVLFISSAGADLAERDKQPRLREFVDLEILVLAAKGDKSTSTGHSPCVIRPGFYAEVRCVLWPHVRYIL